MSRPLLLEYAVIDPLPQSQFPVFLLAVITLAAGACIAGGMSILAHGSRTPCSRTGFTQSDLCGLECQVEAFELDVGRYPTEHEGLKSLTNRPSGATGWKGPYTRERVLSDPFGHPYVYRVLTKGGRTVFRLLSTGPDGVEGTTDDIIVGP
jgi:general secretion pathway protein G